MNVVITAQNVGKQYRVGAEEAGSDTFVGSVVNLLKSPFRNYRKIRGLSKMDGSPDHTRWALRNINFQMTQGEVLGIIGHNGAGKSTLLKILSRITEPSEGEVRITGRVSSLLEVGTGFHPELTGRENVFMNGTILGMTRKEIEGKYDEIVRFSGVENYIHTPVKFYSSGMKVRLAFSVAAHLEPDILIIDEVLAVGDAEFQRKCLGKLNQIAHGGRTVLFVSHDMGAIQSLCTRVILLENGMVLREGEPSEVVGEYLNKFKLAAASRKFESSTSKLRITGLQLLNDQGAGVETVLTGQSVTFALSYESDFEEELPPFAYFHLFVKSIAGVSLFIVSTKYSKLPSRLPANGMIRCRLDKLPLLSGGYSVDACSKMSEDTDDYIPGALTFTVENGTYAGYARMPGPSAGAFVVQHEWTL